MRSFRHLQYLAIAIRCQGKRTHCFFQTVEGAQSNWVLENIPGAIQSCKPAWNLILTKVFVNSEEFLDSTTLAAMAEARLPAAAVGNGRLLVTIDAQGDPLSACWPCIDSPNQMPIFRTTSAVPDEASILTKSQCKPEMGYINDTNTSQATTTDGLFIQDTIIDIDISLDGKDQGSVDTRP